MRIRPLRLASTLLAALVAAPLAAQTFPDKPVRLIVPFPPGGPADAIARAFADKVGPQWKQPVVLDHRPGAGGNLASGIVAKAAPDGYTIVLVASSHVTNGSLYPNLPYDPLRDFTPIAGAAYYALMLVVTPSLPARSLAEMVTYAKTNPGKLTFASAGTGTPTHLTAELFKNAAGIEVIHSPYKGAAPATTDLLGGHVQAMFNNPASALPLVKAGKLRALATTGLERSVSSPDVPTVAESGYPGFEAGTWYGFLGPAGIPAPIVAKLSADLGGALKSSDTVAILARDGMEPWPQTSAALAGVMAAEQKKWDRIIKGANIRLE